MNKLFLGMAVLILSGCQAPLPVQAPLAVIPARQQETQKITLGGVQRSLVKGASATDVIELMGSPNIVTSNHDGSETWVYDKVAKEVEYAGGYASGVAVSSTRTMMVVVKFNTTKTVEDVKYRQTSY